jgi:hypothetical protein
MDLQQLLLHQKIEAAEAAEADGVDLIIMEVTEEVVG